MKNVSCFAIAEAIKHTMGMANLSGFVAQEDGEPLRQFNVKSITEEQEKAVMLLEFAGQGFRIEVSAEDKIR